MATWIKRQTPFESNILDLNGVYWRDAPLPKRWHICKTQTQMTVGEYVYEWCACGAEKVSNQEFGFHGGWVDKNKRRKPRVRRPR